MEQLSALDILDLAEGWDLETKKAGGRDGRGALPGSFFESYAAMANTDGGVILLGIEEKPPGTFSIHGIADVSRLQKTLWDALNDRDQISVNLLGRQDVEVVEVAATQVLRIRVPRARRAQRPVYVGRNPLIGTYRRNYEGDYRCDEETVRRMLAEQVEDARDARLLDGFDERDLDDATLRAYRNQFRAARPDHPWGDLDDRAFLRMIGGWTQDRTTGKEGLTLAGLLMFGGFRSIHDGVPNYIVDYQDRPSADAEVRWVDRVTTDGTWSGNLYDFYRRVIQKLVSDLKVPFRLEGTSRVDETPVHVALREALVNALIHADYTGRVSILVVKQPDGFAFRNPGAMRLPLEDVIDGGQSDCRNRNLQKMFQLAGLGEQAGSGVPRIYRNWREQHWRAPELWDELDPDRTELKLRMVSLLPEDALHELDKRFGLAFRGLSEVQRLALATVVIEGQVTNVRLQRMTSTHPRDLTHELSNLVRRGFLTSGGVARGTYYVFPQDSAEAVTTIEPEQSKTGASQTTLDLVDQIAANSSHNDGNSSHSGQDSSHNDGNSSHSDQEDSSHSHGRSSQSQPLDPDVTTIRTHDRAARPVMERAILALCRGRFVPLRELGNLLQRAPRSLRDHYLSPMVKEGRIELRYPDRPNHPAQGYRTVDQQ